jgi:hypothetical protein
MRRLEILAQSHWAPLAHLDFKELPLASLEAANAFFVWLLETGTTVPTAFDYFGFAGTKPDPTAILKSLIPAFEIISSDQIELVEDALTHLSRTPNSPPQTATSDPEIPTKRRVTGPPAKPKPSKHRDPCARPESGHAKLRRVSIYPWELPETWRLVLYQASHGRPGVAASAPSPSILDRMVQKLCQLAWVAKQSGLPVSLQPETVGPSRWSCLVLQLPICAD